MATAPLRSQTVRVNQCQSSQASNFHLSILLAKDRDRVAVQQRFKSYRRPYQRHVSKPLRQLPHAVLPGVVRRCFGGGDKRFCVATTTRWRGSASNSDWWTTGHVGREKINENVITVVELGNYVAPRPRQPMRVEVEVVPAHVMHIH